MGDYGMSLGYEKDKCSICKKSKEIRIIYCKTSKRGVNICDDCANANQTATPEELVKKYGKKIKTKAEIKKADQLLKT